MKTLHKCIAFTIGLIPLFSYSQSWSLTGNASTNPPTNFIGTTDDKRLVFKTNNVERMTILTTGYGGFNTSTPSKLFVFQGTLTGENGEVIVKQVGSSTFGAYLTLDNTANTNGKSWSIGSSGTSNYPATVGNLEFYQLGVGTRMLIDPSGHVGINLGSSTPSAFLHTSGSVRFQNLPSGTGTALVIDASGNVLRGTSPLKTTANSDDITELSSEINNLKEEIIELKKMMAKNINNLAIDKPVLFQNVPNPSQSLTVIKFYIPDSKKGELVISDLNGVKLESYPISTKGIQQVNIDNKKIGSGIFFYSLYVGGKLIETKKMILITN